MAKQTFTTGQVLTAAQMNSLQSNDFNQTVSVKTASYTLVAADKGTRIEFNTSGSVTCTVNTGLFDAGDTVVIQNRGAGDVTVTAGTATVNTAGSLVISQYQNATLYFISASASILFAGNAGDLTAVTSGTGISISNAGGPVPTITNSMATEITASGDIIVGTGSGTFDNLPIGTTGQVLTADTTVSPYKVKWATAASGGGFTLLETLTLSGSSTTSSTLSGSYKHLFIELKDVYLSGNDTVAMRLNAASSGYYFHQLRIDTTTVSADNPSNFSQFQLVDLGNNSATSQNGFGTIWIPRYTDTSSSVSIQAIMKGYIAGNMRSMITWGLYDNTAAITTVNFRTGGTVTFTAGTAYIYGVS